MARKLRLEFPGAFYHVINRGNYRTWIFADAATRAAFESCLFEACERSDWLLHAFVVMSNHYHLAVETPAGNLVAGMQWLQSTFANRFNRFRDEHGHVFQSRYKSLLVEEGDALGAVCDYILIKDYDLAPSVRAWELSGAREVSAARWLVALELALRRMGKSAADCQADRKSTPWKIAIAAHLKQSTDASNHWLTEQLQMGTPVAASQYVSAFRHHHSFDQSVIQRLTEKLKTCPLGSPRQSAS